MRLLTICIPTYNRLSIIKADIDDYLSLKDERFCLKVVDNCSTDSTYEYLKGIKDSRLIIRQNLKNIGATQNMFASLMNNESKYSLLVLDKDIVDVSMLSAFLDELETSNESFGFIDPEMRQSNKHEVPCKLTFMKGYDSIYKMAYLNQHPSGYIYKSELIDKVCQSNVFTSLEKDFVFPFEVINAGLALEYDSFIFRWPIIIRARERQEDPLSLTYNKSNIWYSAPQRLFFYSTYSNSVFNLNLNLQQKKNLIGYLTQNVLNETTLLLRSLMKNDYACSHYKIQKENVGFAEMHNNVLKVLKKMNEITNPHFSSQYRIRTIVKLYLTQIFKIVKVLLLSRI